MRRMTTTRRGGFTLVELLIVVAILALLAAIATAAFFRVRGSEQIRATEAGIQKLNVGLDARWKAVLDDAKDDLTKGQLAGLIAWAGNDRDRALAIWTYLKLKNEFPTTIQEAGNPVVLTDPTLGTIVSLPPKSVFRSALKTAGGAPIPAGVTVAAPTASRAADESALLFHWALTGSALRCMTFGTDGTTNQTGEVDPAIPFRFGNPPTTDSTLSGRAFKDAYGKPIAFIRLAHSAEINAAPYARPGSPIPPTGSVRVVPNDPLDPQGKLPTIAPAGSGQPWDQGKLNAFWTAATSGHIGYQWNLPAPVGTVATFPTGIPNVGYPFDVDTTTAPGVTLLRPHNTVPSLIAAGDDKTFESGVGVGDDLLGFRLRREGNRGN